MTTTMTLNTSTQFAFRLAFVEMLRTDARFSELEISLFPIDYGKRITAEYIDLFGTRMSGDWGLLGNKAQEEQYVLDGRIVIKQAGSSHEQRQAIIERADELATALQRVVRSNYKMPSMATPIRDCALISMETLPMVDPEDSILIVPFQIRVVGVIDYV